jgi:hypothetical protein
MPLAKIHVLEGRYDHSRMYEVPGENISFGQGEAQRAKAVASVSHD